MPLGDTVILDRERIEAARRRCLLTVGELVERSGTSGKLIWRARTGQAISLAKGKRLARALRVPLSSLLAESGKPVAPGVAAAFFEDGHDE